MTTLTADEIRSRVETDWNRIVKVLAEKVALQSISAKGITAEQMKRPLNSWQTNCASWVWIPRWFRLPMPTALRAHGRSSARISFLRTPPPCCSTPITTCSLFRPGRVEHRPVRGHRN